MLSNPTEKLVVAITSRALFDLTESHALYETAGVEEYANYQIANEDQPLMAGVAFNLVKKLLALKTIHSNEPMVQIILLSRNSADTGLRIFNSIKYHHLAITRAAFTSGENPYRYVQAFGAHLFLSADCNDVKSALEAGCAAATILPTYHSQNTGNTQLRIAFDGDAVLFSDESERIYQQEGLNAFFENETNAAHTPLNPGPFKVFLQALYELQKQYPPESCPIRTALVTARSAPCHERVIRTLRAWNIRIDEGLFLGGLSKGEFLRAFGADFFFDDQTINCESASQHVATGHVPHGIIND